MAYNFPEGAAFYFSSTFAGAKTITAVTNANPAVATSTSHGYSDGDIVLFSSGWEDATDRCYKVDQQDANNFELEGLNSSNTSFFGAGSGTGSTYAVSSWVSIPQVLTVATQGGDARFTQVQPLARRNATQVATGFNPSSMTLSLAYDHTNANYVSMLDISRSLTKVAFKLTLNGGAYMLAYGYMNVSETPTMNSNQVMTVSCALSFLNPPVSYAS
jgi:hypothetical protein